MAKRKFPKVSGYWVYSIKIPSVGKFYIGVSNQQCCQRWNKSMYKGMSLEQYLDEWDSMIKTVLVDGLSKEEAFMYEGKIIDALSMNNLCINTNRSGLITDNTEYFKQWQIDNPEYQKQWRKDNTEYFKQWQIDNSEKYQEYQKQYQMDNKEKIQEYQRQYYQNNKEQINEKRRQRRLKKKLEQQHTSVH